MTSQKTKVKLIVNSSESSLNILKYIATNLVNINKSGYVIVIERVPAELSPQQVERLGSRGITNIPTAIVGASHYKGCNNIRALLSDTPTMANNEMFATDWDAGMSTAPRARRRKQQTLEELQFAEMYDESGEPRDDDEEDDNARNDIDRKLLEYQRTMSARETKGQEPTSRRRRRRRSETEEEPPRQRRTAKRKVVLPEPADEDDAEDENNIVAPTDLGANDISEEMMESWRRGIIQGDGHLA